MAHSPHEGNTTQGHLSDNAPGRYWQAMAEEGRIRCELCPRYCQLRPDQRGFCFVRQNLDGQMALTTYGRSSGFCIDPIEKKPLNHFYTGSSVLSFGTAGCNLGCRFCQNWNISKSRQMDRLADDASPETIARAAQELGCRSVAFTYNDPVIFLEYAVDIAQACHQRDVATVAVTAGYITSQAREEFFSHIDAANIDLKAFSESFYHKLCFAHLDPILDTLLYLKQETEVWFELTTLLIPEENDSDQELHQLTEWVATHLGPDVPLHFTAFHPDFKLDHRPRTPAATLQRARRIAKEKGLHYVYTGNVHDAEGGSTYCPGCGERVIERDWYAIGAYHIKDGRCGSCHTPIAGRFVDQPGTWGPKRLPVRLSSYK